MAVPYSCGPKLANVRVSVEFDTTKFLRGDLLSRYQAYRLAIVTGWMTQNEPRRLEGFNPIPGGDVLLRPMNTEPMGEGRKSSARNAA